CASCGMEPRRRRSSISSRTEWRSSSAPRSGPAAPATGRACTSATRTARSSSSSRMTEPPLVERLAAARIGATFNQYTGSELLRSRLAAHLERDAATVLVGEAAGYRGARVSGLAFTSERQITGRGSAEATATIVHRVLGELGLEDEVLLWNVVPTHPHEPDRPYTNRRPTRD